MFVSKCALCICVCWAYQYAHTHTHSLVGGPPVNAMTKWLSMWRILYCVINQTKEESKKYEKATSKQRNNEIFYINSVWKNMKSGWHGIWLVCFRMVYSLIILLFRLGFYVRTANRTADGKCRMNRLHRWAWFIYFSFIYCIIATSCVGTFSNQTESKKKRLEFSITQDDWGERYDSNCSLIWATNITKLQSKQKFNYMLHICSLAMNWTKRRKMANITTIKSCKQLLTLQYAILLC